MTEEPCDITVHYDDGTSEVHRYVTGERVLELENLAFTAANVVSTDSKPSAADRPHLEFIDFHRTLAELVELVESAGDVQRTGKPLAALGLATHARDRLADLFGGLVGAARLGGASWEAIGRELGLSKQTAYNRFVGCDPTRWDGTSERCGAAGQLLGDTDPCEGPMDAAKVMESYDVPTPEQRETFGVLACVNHGAKLYAQIGTYARVYPTKGPDDPSHAALEIYHRAQEIKAKTTKGQAA